MTEENKNPTTHEAFDVAKAMPDKSRGKAPVALREEEVLKFWQDNKIFEKSLVKDSPAGDFVFYDGPPFATGLPHYGSLLSSIIKDVIPRYKTMRGYHVRRRWGWDCHGLPIESLVEKKLELKNKKDIEKIGMGKFNQEARNMVLQYADDWEKYIDRLGRWVEFKNSYKTMDNSYIESVWWAIKQMNGKGLLYEGNKVLMYCPHCETPLAKAEIAMDNSYKDITEEAVTAKFKIKSEKFKDTYLLAWTTTPWTLPGNVALAVGREIDYVKVKVKDQGYILAKDRIEILNDEYKIIEEIKGKDLVGLKYEPLFGINKIKEVDKENRAYKVYAADFVNTEEGTGIVHTAVMYGEDDFNLGKKEGLPTVALLDAGGRFNENAPEFLRGQYIKKAEKEIVTELESKNLLFAKAPNTHSYPHCYRCGTPLIYNAVSSWFINIQKIKPKLLSLNEKINWVPEHLKHGRFQNIVENAPDWTISRNRYWASPLPIWKNKKTKEIMVLGSVEELKKYTKKSGNKYFTMRHGEAEQNVSDIINSELKNVFHLTEAGQRQASIAAKAMADGEKIDLIVTSPFVRCKETAEIIGQALSLGADSIIVDERLGEFQKGPNFEGKKWDDYWKLFASTKERFKKAPDGGENLFDLNKRLGEFLYNIENRYSNKKILLISHDGPIAAMHMVALGASFDESVLIKEKGTYKSGFAEFTELNFVPLPHNENYELDLHRPWIDEVELIDEDGNRLERVREVVDCWVESGAMPFAELHYPFENEKEFQARFPGDFIAEYIAQTRTWFYYTHVLGTALFDSIAFKNVVTTGNILAKDGSKMSKSKGNYTDPFVNFNIFGADALRFSLMNNVVMQAEDSNFKDEDLREVNNRVINILWNSYKFYDMYAAKNVLANSDLKTEHILDQWIMARLFETVRDASKYLDEYDTIHYCRVIRPFVDDFSTWFLRRSRDRFKSADSQDARQAEAHTRFVLMQFSKVIAPVMPFLAESIYGGLRDGSDPESVHLCSWPKEGKIDKDLLSDMDLTREVVSQALMVRNASGIKVRQPLNRLVIQDERLKDKNDLIQLIKDEVNVKNISFDKQLSQGFLLDTAITAELQKEGNARELVRAVQEFRKNKNLIPSDSIDLLVETDDAGKAFLKEFESEIKKPTNIKEIIFVENDGLELKIGPSADEYKLKIKIK